MSIGYAGSALRVLSLFSALGFLSTISALSALSFLEAGRCAFGVFSTPQALSSWFCAFAS